MVDHIEKFKSQNFAKPKVRAIYGIYSRGGACLWIGETENLYTRLYEHYHSNRGNTIRGCIANDEDISISVDELWTKTVLKTYVVTEDVQRNELKKQLIEELGPRYNKQLNFKNRDKTAEPKTSSDNRQSKIQSSSNINIPNDFYRYILDWNWPNQPSPDSKQSENVSGVIYKLMRRDDFSPTGFKAARQDRADEARDENPNLGDEYESTVRAHCVRELGYRERIATRETATKDFLAEAEKLVRKYKMKT